MKNKINIFGIFALTGILLFAACSDLMNPPNVSTGGETGKLLVQIGDAEARTLTPPSADLGDLRYNLVIKPQYSSTITYEGEIKSEGYTLQANQNYTLDVEAFNTDNELVASYSDSVTIEVGKTATKKIVLRPVANVDIPGKFSYAVTLPPVDQVPYTSATLTLSPQGINSGIVTINLLDSPAAEIDLPPGRYELVINVASPRQINGQELKIYRREVVYIYSRLTTSTVAGEYVFAAEDFEADVRFSGTAQVLHAGDSSENTDYVPKKVYIQLDGDHADDPLGEAAIVKNADTGAYEWELALPSHYVVSTGNLSSVTFKFEATHKITAAKTITSPWITDYLSSGGNAQGKKGITLTAKTTSIVIAPTVDSNALITFVNNDVVQGGQATINIRPPTDYGLIGSSVSINNTTSNIQEIVPATNGVQAIVTIPNAINPVFRAQFFHLEGTAGVLYPNTYNYSANTVEAYEVDADGNHIAIGTAATVGTATQAWKIQVPSNYVFRDSATSNIHFKVLLRSSQPGMPDYTWDNSTYGVYGLTSSTSAVSLFTSSLFEVSNVRAAVQGINSVEISWDNASSWAAGGIKIYRNVNGGGYTLITGTVLENTRTSYIDTNVYTNGNRYSYYVTGTRAGAVEGPPSQVAYAKQQEPGNFTATANTNSHGLLTSVDLSWTHNGAAAEFLIERMDTSSWSWSTVGTPWSGATSYSDSTVDMIGRQYLYRITARTSSGSSYSDYDSDQATSSDYVGPSVSGYTMYWNNSSSGNYIGSGQKTIYRLSNSGYNNSYAYLYLSSDNGSINFTVYNNGTKSSTNYWGSASGNSFYLYDWYSGTYSDLILVVEAPSWSSDYYSFNITN